MAPLTIQIPEFVRLQTGASRAALPRERALWLALHFFQTGRLPSGPAAAMCGRNRVDFLSEAGRQGVPAADLAGDELEWELNPARGH